MTEALGRLTAEALVLRTGGKSFDVAFRPGEIVGLAGLDGHGQDHFIEALAGLRKPAAGRVSLAADRTIDSYRHAVNSGIVYLPRDRRSTGIFPTLSVIDNFAIASLSRDIRAGFIDRRARRRRYDGFRDRLSIVAQNPDASITTLSGGNQQKVLLARLLALAPSVLLLNDPTRGVDVATRRVLYDVFRELAAGGMTLVILSTEIEEITFMCGRVLVFRDHELAAELADDAMTFDRVIAAMFGRPS